MLLDDFKNTVDRYSATISPDDIEQVCRQLGINKTNVYGRSLVTDKLYQNIREAIRLNSEGKADKISRTAFLKWQSDLIYN